MARIVQAIMCGGGGTRLWPMSRAGTPKQLLPLMGQASLLEATVARACALPGAQPADVVLVTGASIADGAQKAAEAGGAPDVTLLLEPAGKNTAAAAAFASLFAVEQDPEAIVVLLPADHHIADPGAFNRALLDAKALAEEGYIATLGAAPTGPHTGYGYIKQGEALARGYRALRFTEKPKLPQAEEFIAEGGFHWNCGVFVFQAKAFLEELEIRAPDIAQATTQAVRAGTIEGRTRRPDPALWTAIRSDSIDFAVAEKTTRCAVVPVSMGWSDIGSWTSLHEASPKDADGNVISGDVLALSTHGSLVRGDGGRLVAVLGVEDLVVVDTPNAVFVAPRARSEEVRAIVDALGKAKRTDAL